MVVSVWMTVLTMNAQNVRETIRLDEGWKFAFGNAADPAKDFGCGTEYFNYLTKANSIHNEGPYSPKFDDSKWEEVRIPHDWAFTILNPTRQDITYSLNWQDFNLTGHEVSGCSTSFDEKVYQVYNLWTHKTEGKTSKKNKPERNLTVKARDVASYRLTIK